MDAQNHLQNRYPQGVSQSHICGSSLNCMWPLTSEIRCLEDSTARKQLEVELGTSCCNLGDVRYLYIGVLVSRVQFRVQVLQRPLRRTEEGLMHALSNIFLHGVGPSSEVEITKDFIIFAQPHPMWQEMLLSKADHDGLGVQSDVTSAVELDRLCSIFHPLCFSSMLKIVPIMPENYAPKLPITNIREEQACVQIIVLHCYIWCHDCINYLKLWPSEFFFG